MPFPLLFIQGHRRSGKTSHLYYLKRCLEMANCPHILIDVGSFDEKENLWVFLLRELRVDESYTRSSGGLKSFLVDTRSVLLIDEWDALKLAPQRDYDLLLNVFRSLRGAKNVGGLVAARALPELRMGDGGRPEVSAPSTFESFKLSPLSEDCVKGLVRDICSSWEILDPTAASFAEYVWRSTSG